MAANDNSSELDMAAEFAALQAECDAFHKRMSARLERLQGRAGPALERARQLEPTIEDFIKVRRLRRMRRGYG
jgi:hypothetical protein